MIKNNKILILTAVLFGFFAISNITFAKDNINCPPGYICLKNDDPLIMASTSACFVNTNTSTILNISIPDEDKNVSEGDSVSMVLNSQDQDHAGAWDNFKPGAGSYGSKEDWNWKLNLSLDKTKTIKSITVINNDGQEGWSTSKDDRLFGKFPYPLVLIDEKGNQLNSKYDQTFPIKEGDTVLDIYGQIETPSLNSPEMVIIFTDHTYLSIPFIATQGDMKLNTPPIADKTLWGRLKGLFGF